MEWDGGWYWWGFGALHMLLYWGLVVLLMAALIRWSGGMGSRSERTDGGRALEMLKERYARGEIQKDEFEQKKRDLS